MHIMQLLMRHLIKFNTVHVIIKDYHIDNYLHNSIMLMVLIPSLVVLLYLNLIWISGLNILTFRKSRGKWAGLYGGPIPRLSAPPSHIDHH